MNTTRRSLLLVGAAVTLSGVLAACGGDPAPEPSTEPTPEWTYGTPSPDPDAGEEEAPNDSLLPQEADQDARDGAAAAAIVTAKAWIQGSTMEQEEWNDALMETLSPIAQDAYDGRWWGYRIRATEITGDPEIQSATMSTAFITVPTDGGDLNLTLARPTPTSQWLTSGIDTAEDPQ